MSTVSCDISRKNAFQLLIGTTALLMGGFVYLTFRSDHLLMFHAIRRIGLGEAVDAWRQSVTMPLPEWVLFCLPDALWSAAYILIVDAILKDNSDNVKLATASIIPAIGTVSELMQAVGMLPGTFDIFDLVAYATPYIIYVLIIKAIKK